ncbi:MAG TPA: flagellar biosynthesis anti-sigma factor FlgM [Terriglobia bacterium]|nr:flagellar biosynthesis anti-sigma factor FlgM [Terriglobia bacterium]
MIDRVNISNQGIDRSQATQGNELVRNTGKNRQVSSGSDSVALSSKAKEMDQLSATIEESRTERFNKVQQALESGTYRVSARDIAERLIDANQK